MKRAIDMLGEDFGFRAIENEETVYVLVDYHEVVYVGKTVHLDDRIKQHKRRGIKFDACLYKSISDDVSGLVEFYLINKLNPKENIADVIHSHISLNRLVGYFHRFTNKEFMYQGIAPLFEEAGIPFSDVYKYSVDDLFDLCLAGFKDMGCEYDDLDFKFIHKWRDKEREDK